MSLEKHLLQQVRRSKFQIEITDYKAAALCIQCGGLFIGCKLFEKTMKWTLHKYKSLFIIFEVLPEFFHRAFFDA